MNSQDTKLTLKDGVVTIMPSIASPGMRTGDPLFRMYLYGHLREAQEDIVDAVSEHIQQFLNHDRAFDEIDFCPDLEVRTAVQLSNGVTVIANGGPEDPVPFAWELIHMPGSESFIHVASTHQISDFLNRVRSGDHDGVASMLTKKFLSCHTE